MKLTLQRPTINRVEDFARYLKDRAQHPDHEANRDLIASFIDKVLIVELKLLDKDQSTYDEVVELPDTVLSDPIFQAKKAFDNAFDKFLEEQGLAPAGTVELNNKVRELERTPEVSRPLDLDAALSKQTPVVPKFEPADTTKPRNGNGHKVGKKRSLQDSERDSIRTFFMTKGGCIEDDDCVAFHKGMGSRLGTVPDISIFQVTGFVTYLHKEVAAGNITFPDMAKYLNWIQSHRDLWAQYNSPKYSGMRSTKTVSPILKKLGELPPA